LLHQDPARFFPPPYVGPSGWIGIWIDKRPNWKELAEIIRDGYDLIAVKRRIAKPRRVP
jgi:hypothetical protein